MKRFSMGIWWIVCFGSVVSAQTMDVGRTAPPNRTRFGSPVVVQSVDAFWTTEQERSLLRLLRQPCSFDWNQETTLIEIAQDVSRSVPTEIDFRSAREVGIDPNLAVAPRGVGMHGHIRFPNRFPEKLSLSKPSTFPARSRPSSKTAANETADLDGPWWKRGRSRDLAKASVASRLLFMLDYVDMTLGISNGQLIITTHEHAETLGCIKIYDVTPLVTVSRPAFIGREATDLRAYRDDELVDAIQALVEPDTWEAMGGPSTNQLMTIGDQHWFACSTTLTTHWKIQSLLDRLNGVQSSGASDQ